MPWVPTTPEAGSTWTLTVIPTVPELAKPWLVAPTVQTLVSTGIASAEAAGVGVVRGGTATLVSTGIPSAEALGVGTVVAGTTHIASTGIPSAEVLGVGTVIGGTVRLISAGIASAEVLGVGAVLAGSVSLVSIGIPSAEAVGIGLVHFASQTLSSVGIPSEETVGVGRVALLARIISTGIPSAEALGVGEVLGSAGCHVYTEFARGVLTGLLDVSVDSIKAMPLSAYVLGSTRDNAVFVADVLAAATEATGGGYAAGGVLLTSVTLTKVGHTIVLSCADPIDFGTTDLAVSHVLFFDAAGGSDATNRVILYWDLGGTQLINGVDPDPAGLLVAAAA